MRRNIKKIFLIIIFLIGLIIFIYPRITNYIYKKKVDSLEVNYIEKVSKIEEKENDKFVALKEKLIYENNKIFIEKQVNFTNQFISYETPLINLTDYGLDDNVFGFLEIPSIDVTLPIYFGSSEEHMRLGATHLTGTSYPIGGENTNSVIAAHRGFYKAEMFRHIDNIRIGDKLIITNPFEKLTYEAYKILIIKPDELDKLTINEGFDMVTLISCHPFPHNYERYAVYFKRIDN